MYTFFNLSDSKENQKAGSWLTDEELGMEEGNLLLSNAKTADNTEDLIYGCLDRCHIPIGRWGIAWESADASLTNVTCQN